MTTIITRLYADKATAETVAAALVSGGLTGNSITVIGDADAAAMKAARVPAASAGKYAAAMTGTQALLVVEAGFNPVGAARKAIKIVGRTASIPCGIYDEDAYISESVDPSYAESVIKGGGLMLTNEYARLPQGLILSKNPISRNRPKSAVMRGGAYMSKSFWPMKLVATPATKRSAIAGGKLISSIFGLPTIFHLKAFKF